MTKSIVVIGSSDSKILKFWEPGAPPFEERFECLKQAFDLGYTTSVSCEPMVDTNPEILVDRLLPYISDTIWLGKANFLLKRMRTNGVKDEASFERDRELIAWQSNDDNILALYSRYENNPKIEWKESIKKILNESALVYYLNFQ